MPSARRGSARWAFASRREAPAEVQEPARHHTAGDRPSRDDKPGLADPAACALGAIGSQNSEASSGSEGRDWGRELGTDGTSKPIQCPELASRTVPPCDLRLRSKELGRTTQLCLFCPVIFFLISEMPQNVCLVNLFNEEVSKHSVQNATNVLQPAHPA